MKEDEICSQAFKWISENKLLLAAGLLAGFALNATSFQGLILVISLLAFARWKGWKITVTQKEDK